MEILILLALVVLLVMFYRFSSSSMNLIRQLTETIYLLKDDIRKLRNELHNDELPSIRKWAPSEAKSEPLPPAVQPAPEVPVAVIPPLPSLAAEVPKAQAPAYEPPKASKPGPPAPVSEPSESWFSKWLRNNPDLEKFIGENLINKIGIAVLVLGLAFFVKYAIDRNWINEVGRVSIGMACGGILIGLAHYMRNSYRSFSSVLAGGGLAVLYFTIAFAFHQYQLMSQTAAFAIMVIITAFAILLALLYDKLELAVIAAAGGFLAPFMVSTGQGNYIVLFSYLIILNVGLVTLSWFKRWPLINIISLAFTAIIYGGWLADALNYSPVQFSYAYALAFATVFYGIFLGMNMIYQLRNRDKFKPFDFSVILFINSLYFTAGMILLHDWYHGRFQGLFTVALGIINFALTYFFLKRKETDKRFLYLLIGLTLTFCSLAIPVQLHGHTITLFWSAEFVLLYWLYKRSEIVLFKYSSALVMSLTVVSLFMDWSQAQVASTAHLVVLYNDVTGFVTNLVCVAAFYVYGRLLSRTKEPPNYLPGVTNALMSRVSFIIAGFLLYLTFIYGVNLLLGHMHSYEIANVYHRIITYSFILASFIYAKDKDSTMAARLKLIGIIVCLIFYIPGSFYTGTLRDMTLNGSYSKVHLLMHFISTASLLYICWLGIRAIRASGSVFPGAVKLLTWIGAGVLVLIFSVEFLHIYIIIGYQPGHIPSLARQYSKAGLSILWGLCSFVMMWLGMKHKYKTLRIISLTLFSIVLLKLFTSDIAGISEGGKIAAFISLGVILLVVSFMYQKLKKIIIDDKA